MQRHLALALALLLPLTASAVPLELSNQGRLLDALGAPLDGSNDVTFALYDTVSGGTALWTETQTLELDNGYFSATLTGFEAADFDGDDLWIGVAVNSGPELPDRLPLTSVPFAIRSMSAASATTADTATNVDGGTINATSITVNGTTIVDDTGSIVSALPTHVHDTADITTGTLDINRIPVGSDANSVAGGNHTHDATDIISGTLDITRIPVGGGSDQVAAGNHSHDISTLTGTDLDGSLNVAGNLTIGTPGTCDSTTVGALSFEPGDGTVRVCHNDTWRVLWSPVPDGTTPSSASTSCSQIKTDYPSSGDGQYYLDTGSGAYLAQCDMTTDGGGWTFVANISDAGSDVWSQLMPADNTGAWESNSTIGTSITHVDDYKSQAYIDVAGKNLLITHDDAGEKVLRTNDDCLGGQTLRAVFEALSWDGLGSDTNWSDASGAKLCTYVNFGYNDPVLRATGSTVLGMKWGEADGVQDGNKDRTMITTANANGNNHHIDAPTGLGGFTAYNASQNYEDANECQGDGPDKCSNAAQNYGLWVR